MKPTILRTLAVTSTLALTGAAFAHPTGQGEGPGWFGPGGMMGGFFGPGMAGHGPGMMGGYGPGMMGGYGPGMMGGYGPGYGPGGMMGGGMMMGPGFMGGHEEFDADGDGRITFDEMREGMDALVSEHDADGDGGLSLEEFEALHQAMMRDHMVDRFQLLDEDGDGEVTRDEMHEPARMFDRMRRFWSGDTPRGRMMDDE